MDTRLEDFRKQSSDGYPLIPLQLEDLRPKNCQVVIQGSKSSNDNWRDHSSDLYIAQEVPSGSASRLGSVISKICSKNKDILFGKIGQYFLFAEKWNKARQRL